MTTKRVILTWLAGGLLALGTAAQAANLDDAIEAVVKANVAAADAQARIEKLSDEKGDLLSRYRTTLEEIDSLKVYTNQIATLTNSQEEEMGSLRDQIDRVTRIAREVTPLMVRMLEALEQFVQLDVPFLADERTARIEHLRKMMDRSDVTDSEKYRRILEAYQIENEYGRTIEAYQGKLSKDDPRTVNFLRIGRVALVYQTLDENEAAVWDQAARAWKPLDGDAKGDLKKGLRIARKQAAPDLIRLPVQAAVAGSAK